MKYKLRLPFTNEGHVFKLQICSSTIREYFSKRRTNPVLQPYTLLLANYSLWKPMQMVMEILEKNRIHILSKVCGSKDCG